MAEYQMTIVAGVQLRQVMTQKLRNHGIDKICVLPIWFVEKVIFATYQESRDRERDVMWVEFRNRVEEIRTSLNPSCMIIHIPIIISFK
jgi:hypothetical protein